MHDELIKYELERTLLSKLLMHPELYYENAEKLSVNIFDNMFHKRVYEMFLVMQSEQKDIDLVSMSAALGCDHEEKLQLSSIYTEDSVFSSVKSCIKQLHEESRKRQMHTLLTEAQNKYLNGESVDDVLSYINKMNTKISVVKDSDVADIKTQMMDFLKDLEKRINTDCIVGVTT